MFLLKNLQAIQIRRSTRSTATTSLGSSSTLFFVIRQGAFPPLFREAKGGQELESSILAKFLQILDSSLPKEIKWSFLDLP